MEIGNRPGRIVLLAGPNGAGKSTAAPALLKGALEVTEFVNADVIAQGLSAFEQEGAALAAGRAMITRLRELARQRKNFAFETTLASRSFAPWIAELAKDGWSFHLLFLWLASADLAVQRVLDRVRSGGHGLSEKVIRRRYDAGVRNFFDLYRPLANSWRIYDNSKGARPYLVAIGEGLRVTTIRGAKTWARIQESYKHER